MNIEVVTHNHKKYINVYVDKSTTIGVLHCSHEISVTFVKKNNKLVFDYAWHCGVSDMEWNSSEEDLFEETFPGLLKQMRQEITAKTI